MLAAQSCLLASHRAERRVDFRDLLVLDKLSVPLISRMDLFGLSNPNLPDEQCTLTRVLLSGTARQQ
jgi:hypothetical protein